MQFVELNLPFTTCDMITNEAGQVAIRRYRQADKIVSVGNAQYVFRTRANISMAWIDSEHVGAVLGMRRQCCSGAKKPEFHYASDVDVRRWTNGGGR